MCSTHGREGYKVILDERANKHVKGFPLLPIRLLLLLTNLLIFRYFTITV